MFFERTSPSFCLSAKRSFEAASARMVRATGRGTGAAARAAAGTAAEDAAAAAMAPKGCVQPRTQTGGRAGLGLQAGGPVQPRCAPGKRRCAGLGWRWCLGATRHAGGPGRRSGAALRPTPGPLQRAGPDGYMWSGGVPRAAREALRRTGKGKHNECYTAHETGKPRRSPARQDRSPCRWAGACTGTARTTCRFLLTTARRGRTPRSQAPRGPCPPRPTTRARTRACGPPRRGPQRWPAPPPRAPLRPARTTPRRRPGG